ncbi:hypothetical protein DDN23_07525 [Vibrio cholerae]|nr:hypothetical protein [Vibrio cholerae]MDN6977999.1 hypothetical protein [Vibrio cholerae]
MQSVTSSSSLLNELQCNCELLCEIEDVRLVGSRCSPRKLKRPWASQGELEDEIVGSIGGFNS